MRKVLIGLIAAGICAGGFLLWVRHELATKYFAGSDAETFVDIPRGENTRGIADLLVDAGVLHSRLPFVLYIRWTGSTRHLQAGEYRFVEPATPIQIVERLVKGDVYFKSVTIPEGLTAQETLELVASCGLGNLEVLQRALYHTEWISDLDPKARSLEGYLFPNTYHFGRKADSNEIVKSMVDQFREQFKRLEREKPLPQGWDTAGIVTLASMIEKEVNNPQERMLVASVLTNRLARGIPLACDPTVIYALKLTGKFDGNIHKRDLTIESPYNTYIYPGLPPGPIANPGLDSIRAAMAPPKTDLLYFVSRNDGTHQFSKDFRSHQNAVARYQKRGLR